METAGEIFWSGVVHELNKAAEEDTKSEADKPKGKPARRTAPTEVLEKTQKNVAQGIGGRISSREEKDLGLK